MDTWVSVLLSTSGVLVAVGIVWAAIRKSARGVRRMVHLVDEVIGKEGVGGQPGTLGLSARLAAIEYELKPNGGNSLADKINRLEVWTTGHSLVHAELNERYFSKQKN